MPHQTKARRGPNTPDIPDIPDIEDTKDHILAAGRELLLAACGALHFCRDYVEKSVPEANRPALMGFFKRAIAVADELGSSISGISALKRTAEDLAKPFFTALEREMCEGHYSDSLKKEKRRPRPEGSRKKRR